MVKEISSDVRNKRKYKRSFIIVSIFIGVIILWLGVLGYGRASQNNVIDYSNPFLKTTYGYAVLPEPGQAKNVTFDKGKWIDPHGQVDTQVMDAPLSSGDWLKFNTGQYTKQTRYAVVKHKGSYVYSIQLITKDKLPKLMQVNGYYPHSPHEPRVGKRIPWWPFS
ncbi:hypothetical protein ACYATP_08460 [Lactobacillaceae bacterium Melli_B4]